MFCGSPRASKTASDEDGRTIRNEAVRRSETDSTIASLDDRYFSFQLSHAVAPIGCSEFGRVV
jgi:hypothetical protein